MSTVGCAGGCGKWVAAEDVEHSGWSYLHITGRYRCGSCERELNAASSSQGGPHDPGSDNLPPDSIGALKQLPEAPPLREGVKP